MVFLWIALYGLVYTLAGLIPRQAHPWFQPLMMLCYLGLLLYRIFCTGLDAALGLCLPQRSRRRRLLPLLMLPCYHLFAEQSGFCMLPEMLLMVSTCAVEELFFRGFLLRTLRRYGTRPAVFISSAAFALCHMANLAAGAAPFDVLAQVLCAFFVGICYSVIALQTGSLLWGYAAHLLTNITAPTIPLAPSFRLWLCIAGYCVYGIFLYKSISEEEEKKP